MQFNVVVRKWYQLYFVEKQSRVYLFGPYRAIATLATSAPTQLIIYKGQNVLRPNIQNEI